MIIILDHTNLAVAQTIYDIWQVSYAIEARLLNASVFPPLQRSVPDFLKSTTEFYGFFFENKLAAVMEISKVEKNTHIQSLVVHPKYFRRGIGEKLVLAAFDNYDTDTFTVETGALNAPAISLYTKLGFKEVNHYFAAQSIQKVCFEKRR